MSLDRFFLTPLKIAAGAAALFASVNFAAAAPADEAEAPTQATVAASPDILRICAADNEFPFSIKDGSGFENKVAVAVANAMGRKPVFVWANKPAIYLVRDWLDKNFCDVVVGLDFGDERVLTTTPYFRSGYAFVIRKDSKLTVTDWSSPDLAKADRIGFVPGTPSQLMMEQIGIFNTHFNYMHSLTDFQDRRNKYTRIDPRRMVNDVRDGRSDLAVVFAPDAARYVKASPDLKLVLIPDDNKRADGSKVPHHFDQAMGVRKQDTQLLNELETAIAKAKPEIESILKEEGFPLLPTQSRS